MRVSPVTTTFQVVSFVLGLFIVVVLGATNKQCNLNLLRLPERVRPTHYDLLLRLSDMAAATYEGQIKINVTIGQLDGECLQSAHQSFLERILFNKRPPFGCDQREIVLNANSRVHIREARFVLDTRHHQTHRSAEICRDEKNEMVSIRFNRKLQDNSHGQLVVDFLVDAGANEKEHGLYKSTWWDRRHNKSYVSIVTQFMAASARKAMPCFDEPAYKSTFDVTIEHERNLTAVANTMPVRREPVKGHTDLVRTSFHRTPIMSTYLLAFSVGQYDHLESKIMDEMMLLRVFTPPDHLDKGRIALEVGRRAYAALRDYFDIEQPLEKIDFLPVRMGFGSAMENWGLVTIQDNLLLADDDAAKNDSLMSFLAVIISHELAHHWFGNLVTMKWWDNLWLNEAFAQWLGYHIADLIYPEYNLKITEVEDQRIVGLEADAISNKTHPIKNANLETIKDIEDSFDDITYAKGGAVLRMLEGHVGHETFKLAIRDYLNKFKYQNTDERDLWNALEARSQLPVARMMDTWLNQAGFPIVSVKFAPDMKGIVLRQDRFEEEPSSEGQRQLWIIPIKMLVMRDGHQPGVIEFVLSDREQEVGLPDWFEATKGHWLKLNADAEGFFRVRYDPAVLQLMREPVKSKQMYVIDRINLLDDLRALLGIKKVENITVKEFLGSFSHEDSSAVILRLARLVDTLQMVHDGHTETHLLLVDYFNRILDEEKRPPRRGKSKRDRPTEKAVLVALIRANYGPAVELGRRRLSQMSGRQKLLWPELLNALHVKIKPLEIH